MAVTTTTGFTVEDLDAMPDDGHRYELIGGAIVMTPAAVPMHQRVLLRLAFALAPVLPNGHELFVAPIGLDLPDGQRVESDLVIAPVSSVGPRRLTLPVLLVVEIVSGGSVTHDRVTKREAYAVAGIPRYWLVDLPANTIMCLRLGDDGAYDTYTDGARIEVESPVAVSLSLAELTAGPTA
ncbi:MAG: Uma2 family endonuclease [Acidimicrobiales bacterium]